MIRFLRLAILLVGLLSAPAAAETLAGATSPDGTIAVGITIDGDGRASYSVTRRGKPLIADSRIGFNFTDADPLWRGLTVTGSDRSSAETRWEQPWGERRFVTDRHNELLVHFAEKAGERRPFDVRIRLFNNGVGFRYEMPARAGGRAWNIAEELTEFNLASNGTAWWIPGGAWNRYEYLYNKTSIDAVATAHTPITMKLADGTHLAFHEAALVDYSAMWFRRIDGTQFRATLSPGSGPKVVRTGAFHTPWRTIRIADDAAGLYDNDIDLNLNEPNKLGDVSWVRPFKYIGIWWGMFVGRYTWATGPKHGATTANAKEYIDFAAAHGFDHLLIEGWNPGWDGDWFGHGDQFDFTRGTPDFDIRAVTDYGRAKGVQLIGHHETGGNIAVYESQLDAAFALDKAMGIHAVKTGYVADVGGIIAPGAGPGETVREYHDGQRQVQHHLKVVETAARYQVAIDTHEPVKDTGLRRTYPNWVAREGARGMEYNAFGDPANPPGHEATLVFTRMLSGPMDFTPGVLSLEGNSGHFLNSTLAKQLALYLTIYSPIQMAADLPERLARYPRELSFIAKVPSDWAETHTLMGEVGDYVVQARKDRRSEDWYVGGLSGEDARGVTVPLGFLAKGRRYRATLYRDAPSTDYRTAARHDIVIEQKVVRAGDTLPIRMAAAGGFAIRLEPMR